MAEPKQNLPVASGPPLYATLPPAVRQIGLLVGIAAAVAAGVALVFWSQSPNFTLLYTGLADRDVGEIVAVMDSCRCAGSTACSPASATRASGEETRSRRVTGVNKVSASCR